MEKKSSRQEHNKFGDGDSSVDRISMLPDDILVSILSLLSVKEAMATSILSHQWRNVWLWTFLPRLDFDGRDSLVMVDMSRLEILDEETWNYVRWVNHVIKFHNTTAAVIQEFRVFFTLCITQKEFIDEWLRFALSRKVEMLELNLTDKDREKRLRKEEYYTFPNDFLRTDDVEFSRYLKKLSLRYVNVNVETLELLLRKCPLLEDLSLHHTAHLSSVKIVAPFPSFKRLEIVSCDYLDWIEFRDADLVCFEYDGEMKRHFVFENVPHLVEVSVAGYITYDIRDVISAFSCLLPQLEKFKIQLNSFSWQKTKLFSRTVKMSNLKELVVEVRTQHNYSLLPLTKLLHASPRLEIFVLLVNRADPSHRMRMFRKVWMSYPHLKEVTFVGYSAVTSDAEFVMHLVESASALKKIVVNSRQFEYNDYARICNPELAAMIQKREKKYKKGAKRQLGKMVPPTINLDIV